MSIRRSGSLVGREQSSARRLLLLLLRICQAACTVVASCCVWRCGAYWLSREREAAVVNGLVVRRHDDSSAQSTEAIQGRFVVATEARSSVSEGLPAGSPPRAIVCTVRLVGQPSDSVDDTAAADGDDNGFLF